jgi:hypothetical protein
MRVVLRDETGQNVRKDLRKKAREDGLHLTENTKTQKSYKVWSKLNCHICGHFYYPSR